MLLVPKPFASVFVYISFEEGQVLFVCLASMFLSIFSAGRSYVASDQTWTPVKTAVAVVHSFDILLLVTYILLSAPSQDDAVCDGLEL